jgi:hypothetical protein
MNNDIIDACVNLLDQANSEEAALREDHANGRIAAAIADVERAIPDLTEFDVSVFMGAMALLWGLHRGQIMCGVLPTEAMQRLVDKPVSVCIDALIRVLNTGQVGEHNLRLTDAIELLMRLVSLSLARAAVQMQIEESDAVREGVEKALAARRARQH